MGRTLRRRPQPGWLYNASSGPQRDLVEEACERSRSLIIRQRNGNMLAPALSGTTCETLQR